MYDINQIFEFLCWNNSEEIQAKGISEAKKIDYLSVLIMPKENKNIWENCAKVLTSKSDQELQMYYCDLLEWLQDMNWPGADIIYDRLKKIFSQEFINSYKYSLSIAMKTEDLSWEQSLKSFYVDYILNLIDERNSLIKQKKGIELAREVNDLNCFIKPYYSEYSKNIWENCAVILSERTDSELQPYLSELLEWLQDFNFPGSLIIFKRLTHFQNCERLAQKIESCVDIANFSENRLWLMNMAKLLENNKLLAHLSSKTQNILDKHRE